MKNTCCFYEIKENMRKMGRGMKAADRLFHDLDAGSDVKLNYIADQLEQACACAKAAVCYSRSIHFNRVRDLYYCEMCCDVDDEKSTLTCSFRSSNEYDSTVMNYDEMIAELTVMAFCALEKGVQLYYCARQLIEDPKRFEMHQSRS